MKINVRLLLITFTIVVLVTASSSLVYYSLTNRIITSEQKQNILNATSDFIFNFQLVMEELDDNYKKLLSENDEVASISLNSEYTDFIFTLRDDQYIDFDNFSAKNNLNIRSKYLTLIQFLNDNPNLILKYDVRDDNTYYYGKVISEEVLNEISEKIRANIAFIINEVPAVVTSSKSKPSLFSKYN
ncbi:MAG: hypothetical protein U5K00_17585 [Melioribacteraceae bacterium]|nr:hypothetical protein [Melioribacteraceae bacterium]